MAPKEDAAAAMKRKAEDGDSPAPKEAKVDKVEKFLEPDDEGDSRATLKETIGFDARETTLNVINTMGGRMLMTLAEGGMQYLLAGARANVGVKSGRYMYEVRMVEALTSATVAGGGRATPTLVKHLVRIGFSVGGSSLFLASGGEAEADGVCFDSDGFWICPGQKKKEQGPIAQKFGKDNVMAIVLNLDPDSPNANTVTLFKDGVQVSQHMKLPEVLIGKVLFPHVTYRNASIQVHFGPTALEPLPYKCRTLQGAACEDVKVEYTKKPQDGKYDVVFPVGVPDEGTFVWLEEFLKENPHYVELSDRKIVEWASKSGLWKPKGTQAWKSSNDKPEFNFGIAALDDLSAQKIISIAAPLVPRHYVVMEVRGNLVPSIRKKTLKRFKSANFKRIAKIMIGDPDKKYQEKVLGLALKQKQDQLDEEFKKKKAEIQRKRQIGNRQKQLAEARKAAEETAAKKKAADEEAKKKRVADLMAKREADAENRKKKEEEEAAAKALKKEEAAAEAAEKKAEEEEEERKKAEEEAKDKPEKTEEEKKAEAEAAEEKAKAAAKKEEEKAEKAKKEEEEKAAKAEKEEEERAAKAKKEELKREKEQKEEEKKQEEEKKKAEEKQKKDAEELLKEEERKKQEAEEDAETCPVAVLTDEEKVFFPKREQSDLTSGALSNSFFEFAVPDKAEGFDEVDFKWFKEPQAQEYLKSWVAERKITIRVEDLAPGAWFKGRFAEWQKTVEDWKQKQKQFKADTGKMNAMMARDTKEAKKLEANEDGDDAKKKEGEEKQEGEDAEMKDGEEKNEDDDAEKKDGEDVEMKDGDDAAAKEGGDAPQESSRTIDIWGVTDLSDIGNGEPLFLHFSFEDWALLNLRYELNLMVRAFLVDTNDADRVGIPESHLIFYYNKYYNKQLSTNYFGADSVQSLVAMIKDVIGLDEKVPVLKSMLEHPGDEENFEVFAKMTEEKRRERQRRIDAGDETVRLKFNIKAVASTAKSAPHEPKMPGKLVPPRPKGQAWTSPSWKSPGGKPSGAWKGGGKNSGWR